MWLVSGLITSAWICAFNHPVSASVKLGRDSESERAARVQLGRQWVSDVDNVRGMYSWCMSEVSWSIHGLAHDQRFTVRLCHDTTQAFLYVNDIVLLLDLRVSSFSEISQLLDDSCGVKRHSINGSVLHELFTVLWWRVLLDTYWLRFNM